MLPCVVDLHFVGSHAVKLGRGKVREITNTHIHVLDEKYVCLYMYV